MNNIKKINQSGDRNINIDENNGEINIFNYQTSKLSNDEIIDCFNSASVDLNEYTCTFDNKVHIDRTETDQLFKWINSDLQENKSPVAILVGNAGFGKSVILSDLYKKLKQENIPVLGLKADRIVIRNLLDLKNELQLNDNIESIFRKIAETHLRLVFLIDQIDALSQSLSSDRSQINTYHSIINKLCTLPNLRIIISCRIYDLDYDPILQQYRNKEIFRTTSLTVLQVENVFLKLKYDFKKIPEKLKEFLRIPLHLQIFCKINRPESFNDNTTMLNLYDALWEEYVIVKPDQNKLEHKNVIKFIEVLSEKMYNDQQIVADSRFFIDDFKREIEYLTTNEIIIKNATNKIQFVHQSFFDFAFARLFVNKNYKLSNKLIEQHQGLFVRSKVKQVLDYLREINPKEYIEEVEMILFGNYRFHIKLLIINNMGFYESPIQEEKSFLKEKLLARSEFSKIFIESVYSCEWFRFLTIEIGLNHYFLENDEKGIDTIYVICRKLIEKCPNHVLSFLRLIPNEFEKKNHFIGRTLLSINENGVENAFELFNQIKNQLDDFSYYHFLEKSVRNHTAFVINELKQKLLNYNPKTDISIKRDFIPDTHESTRVYEKLKELNPELAIPFFIDVIGIISERSKILYNEKFGNEIIGDYAYLYYVPFKDNNNDLIFEIYDDVLKYISGKFDLGCFEEAKTIILPLLNSNLTAILNIPLTFLIKHPHEFINEIFELLSKPNFLINYSERDQLFTYQVRELVKYSYTYFSSDQKEYINQLILKVIPDYERSKESAWNAKGVTQFGYTRFGLSQYHLLFMVPENERKQYKSIDQQFNEFHRKFGEIKNSPPKGIVVTIGDRIMKQQAYENMTYKDWKKSFRKYVDLDRRAWDGVSELGHSRKFEEIVTNNPAKYAKLIEEIIEDESISQSYIVYSLQGLSKGNFNVKETRRLFFKCLKLRREKLEREFLLYLIWLTEYFIYNDAVNDDVIKFLVEIAYSWHESKPINEELLLSGINTVRGAAVDRLVKCIRYEKYEDEIFSTLEFIALKSSPQTRACALYHLAYFFNRDKDRTIKLFLLLNHDFNPKLISIELHNGNALRYFFSSQDDYLKLLPFIKKSIEIEESHSVMTNILFWAWLSDYAESENLLKSLLAKSTKAQKKVIEVAFGHISEQRYFNKCLQILSSLLGHDLKELGETYEHEFIHLQENLFNPLFDFLIEYVSSEIGKYRDYHFYRYLLKITKDEPEKCIELVLKFHTHLKPDFHSRMLMNEPLQIVIQAYNAIREYKVETKYLEMAMNVFDEMLKEPDYRVPALEVLQKLDA